jgi:hypothetical protein
MPFNLHSGIYIRWDTPFLKEAGNRMVWPTKVLLRKLYGYVAASISHGAKSSYKCEYNPCVLVLTTAGSKKN